MQFVLVDFGGTGVIHDEVVACAAALTKQAQQHVALPQPYGWGVGANTVVRAAAGPTDIHPDEMILALLQSLDESGALGYHALSGKGAGFSKICPPLDRQDGSPWTSTASHEMLEVMGDLTCQEAVQASDGKFWAKELCLAGDTRVLLADGTTPTIDSIARGARVRAVDGAGCKVAALGTSARLTARGAEVVRVVLVGGESIRCTPEHRFVLEDGSYCMAKDLVSGSRLFADTSPGLAAAYAGDRPVAVRRAESLGTERAFATGKRAVGHTVVVYAVEPGGKCDVYDLSVPGPRNFQLASGVFVHNCDPCELTPYFIDGVAVSDFVLPAWFTGSAGAFNWCGTIKSALELLPGGYAQYYDPIKGWQQVYSQTQKPRSYRLNHMGRRRQRSDRYVPGVVKP